jgi:hypothetical protein
MSANFSRLLRSFFGAFRSDLEADNHGGNSLTCRSRGKYLLSPNFISFPFFHPGELYEYAKLPLPYSQALLPMCFTKTGILLIWHF